MLDAALAFSVSPRSHFSRSASPAPVRRSIVAALVMVYISSFGLVFPNAAHEAIHPLPEIAGLASAVLVATQMLFGALGGVPPPLSIETLRRWRSETS